ncbi:hypothetical protein EVA_04730 [gut metagenome]|uniref:Uncharacterized protein n=1 Tax=gut metagenome TaxID=749906 RepID=J9GHZ7_9ZZZZ
MDWIVLQLNEYTIMFYTNSHQIYRKRYSSRAAVVSLAAAWLTTTATYTTCYFPPIAN